MTTLTGMNPVFEPVLAELSERHRDEVLAAFAAVEHSPEPVPEAQLLALRDATLRRSLDDLLHRVCLLYTSPSPRDGLLSRMPSSA